MTSGLREAKGLANDRIWMGIAVLAGFLAIFKGIRLPNRWAATQAQLDYSEGLVKRGLFGAIFSRPLHLEVYSHFVCVAFAVMALFFCLLLALVRSSSFAAAVGGWDLVALFAGSYSVTMLASTVGYFDIVLGVLAMALLLVRNSVTRGLLALPVSVCGLLVHEIYLLTFFPLVLASLVLQGMNSVGRQRLICMALAAVLVASASLIGFGLAKGRPLSDAQVEMISSRVVRSVDFQPRMDFFAVLSRSAGENARIVKYREPFWISQQLRSILVFGPTLLLLLLAGGNIVRIRLGQHGLYAFFVYLACALSPLLLHLQAWDVGRINGLCCLCAFLGLIVIVRFTPGRPLAPSMQRQAAVSVVLLLSTISSGLLMLREDRFFPGYRSIEVFAHQLQHMTLPQIANLSD